MGSTSFFDLDARDGGEFRLGQRGKRPWWLPLNILLDGKALRQFQRGLERERLDGVSDPDERGKREVQVDQWNELADALVQAFSTYAIPVMPFLTDDLGVATRTFERINTQGTSMNEVDIVAALTWSENFDFRQRLEDAVGQLEDCGWGGLGEKLILQTCKAALGFNALDTSNQLRGALAKKPHVVEQSARTLRTAAEFLAKRCKIMGPSTLPYGYQVILLAEAFRELGEEKATPKLRKQLVRWLWATTLGEHFAGMRSSKWSRTLAHLLEVVRGTTTDFPPELPQSIDPTRRFDFRSARSRALMIWMAEDRTPMRANGKRQPRPHDLLAEKGHDAVPKLLTSRELGKDREDGPENRLIVDPNHARELKNALLEAPTSLLPKVAESHFINAKALEALVAKDWQGFLSQRRATLVELEQRYAAKYGLAIRDV